MYNVTTAPGRGLPGALNEARRCTTHPRPCKAIAGCGLSFAARLVLPITPLINNCFIPFRAPAQTLFMVDLRHGQGPVWPYHHVPDIAQPKRRIDIDEGVARALQADGLDGTGEPQDAFASGGQRRLGDAVFLGIPEVHAGLVARPPVWSLKRAIGLDSMQPRKTSRVWNATCFNPPARPRMRAAGSYGPAVPRAPIQMMRISFLAVLRPAGWSPELHDLS